MSVSGVGCHRKPPAVLHFPVQIQALPAIHFPVWLGTCPCLQRRHALPLLPAFLHRILRLHIAAAILFPGHDTAFPLRIPERHSIHLGQPASIHVRACHSRADSNLLERLQTVRPALKSGSRWVVFSEPVRKRENLLSKENPDSVRTKSNRAFQSGECDNNLRLPADTFAVRQWFLPTATSLQKQQFGSGLLP